MLFKIYLKNSSGRRYFLTSTQVLFIQSINVELLFDPLDPNSQIQGNNVSLNVDYASSKGLREILSSEWVTSLYARSTRWILIWSKGARVQGAGWDDVRGG